MGEFSSGSLFFAVGPDIEAAEDICRSAGVIKRARQFKGDVTEPERLHVTLFFLGDCSDYLVRKAYEAAAEVRMTPFKVSFDRTASFRGGPDKHPFVLLGDSGLQKLISLRQMLGRSMTQKGLRRMSNTGFTPHLTLLYDKRNVEEQPIEPISWTVKEFVLIQSMRGHRYLGRWPLCG